MPPLRRLSVSRDLRCWGWNPRAHALRLAGPFCESIRKYSESGVVCVMSPAFLVSFEVETLT